jgi:hypothetical protein
MGLQNQSGKQASVNEKTSLIPHDLSVHHVFLQMDDHSTSPCGNPLFMQFSGESQG